ncbi:MAG: FAD-binding protein [Verrucomicrobia bacterium]|nr:FAD-binding protein [Verrucomicrobiota bacterium]
MPRLTEFDAIIRRDEPLSPYTHLRLGGPAEMLVQPHSLDELSGVVRACFEQGVPLRVLGCGCNMLVRDEGVSGAVLRLSEPAFTHITVEATYVQATANYSRPAATRPSYSAYKLPSIDLLQKSEKETRPTYTEDELKTNQQRIVEALAHFDIEVSPGDITRGSTITRYELYPAPGVRVERIVNLERDLSRTMKAERINILAPVPGRDTVAIEVANSAKIKVLLRDLLESGEWSGSRAHLPVSLGKDVYGATLVDDLADLPHVLIAGTTGSGKSVCINTLLLSLLYRFGPDDLRLILIDPKVVELQVYNRLPHLVVPVVTEPKKVLLALKWTINEISVPTTRAPARPKVWRSWTSPRVSKGKSLPHRAAKSPCRTAFPSSSSSSMSWRISCRSLPPRWKMPSPCFPPRPAPPASTWSSPPRRPAPPSSPASSKPTSPPASPSRFHPGSIPGSSWTSPGLKTCSVRATSSTSARGPAN